MEIETCKIGSRFLSFGWLFIWYDAVYVFLDNSATVGEDMVLRAHEVPDKKTGYSDKVEVSNFTKKISKIF